jgi:hypothetical protein
MNDLTWLNPIMGLIYPIVLQSLQDWYPIFDYYQTFLIAKSDEFLLDF